MSFEANSFRISRFTEPTDTITTDSILFNDANASGFKDSKIDGAYLLTLERSEPEGIGNNQAAEKPDGNVQPLGIVEGTFVLKGFITNMRGPSGNGDNSILETLEEWKAEPQAIVDKFEAGRFGFVDSSDQTNTVTVIGTGTDAVGLIFENYQKINNYNRNRVDITLTFRRSRGIDI